MKNVIERIKIVKAMELLARQINDESVFMSWLISAVADGDIEYGDLDVSSEDVENLDYYIEDDANFADILDTFLDCMARARKSGGLYADGVVSNSK